MQHTHTHITHVRTHTTHTTHHAHTYNTHMHTHTTHNTCAHTPAYLQAFARYLAYKKDNNKLLLFILKQLAQEQLSYNKSRYGGTSDVDTVEIPEEDFTEKVPVIMATQASTTSCYGN